MSSSTSKLSDQTALVTGASKGIGASIAKHFAAAGATFVVNHVSSKVAADRIVSEIAAAGGHSVAIQADVSKPADLTRLLAATNAVVGKLDILVNNAGVYEYAPLDAITGVPATGSFAASGREARPSTAATFLAGRSRKKVGS